MHLSSTMTKYALVMQWLSRSALERIFETIENVNKLEIVFDLYKYNANINIGNFLTTPHFM